MLLSHAFYISGAAGPRSAKLSMNEFGMLAEVITEVGGQEGSFDIATGGAGQGYNPLGGGAGSGGPSGAGSAPYRYHGTAQEGTRSSGGETKAKMLPARFSEL